MGQTRRRSHQDIKKSGGDSKQCWGSPRGFPDNDNNQYHGRNDKRISDQHPSAYKQECVIRGIEPRMRPARKPRAHHDRRVIPGADEPCIHTDTQPRILPPGNGDHTGASARNWKIWIKSSSFQTLHRSRRGDKKEKFHSGSASLTVSTDGSVGRIRTSHGVKDATTYVQLLWGDWKNQPQVNQIQYYGALLPHITLHLPYWKTLKREGVWRIRMEDDCRCNDGVKRDQPFGTKIYF